MVGGAEAGIINPEFYSSLVTMHGTFMISFAIMPLLVGTFGNFLIPLKIGAPDVAFPRSCRWSQALGSIWVLPGAYHK